MKKCSVLYSSSGNGQDASSAATYTHIGLLKDQQLQLLQSTKQTGNSLINMAIEGQTLVTIEALKVAHEMVKKRSSDDKMVCVPPRLYQAHPESYTPLFISLGPFHHIRPNSSSVQGRKTRFRDVNILAMETTKQAYMLTLLKMYPRDSEESLLMCQNLVQENLDKIWSCYCDDIEISPEILGKIMLVDSCFLLWFLSFGCNSDIMYLALRRDLFLLENQIPMFILEGLNQILSHPPSSLAEKILRKCALTPRLPSRIGVHPVPECIHMLDLVTKYHLPPEATNNLRSLIRENVHAPRSRTIHLKNATKLRARGVTFQRATENELLHLQFSDGVLRIPAIILSDHTETLLINLLAHEHLSPHSDGYFTSYVFFMSHLIESKEDLRILEKVGIVHNELGSREDASKLFSNVRKQFVMKHFWYAPLCKKIEDYTKSKRRRHIQVLQKKYFGSPWTALSVLAAAVLLVFTLLQTIYTVLSYYR